MRCRRTAFLRVLAASALLSGAAACGPSSSSEDGGPAVTPDAGSVPDGGPAPDAGSDAASDPDAGAEPDAGPRDETPPTVVIGSPRDGAAIGSRLVRVTGTAGDDVGVTELAHVDGDGAVTAIELAEDGTFAFELEPAPGPSTIAVRARDAGGHETTATVDVHLGHRLSGGNSQAAMLRDGVLHTWGRNELGQLGNGTLVSTVDDADPAGVYRHDGLTGLVSIVTRQTFMIALHGDGRVFTWGSNGDGQLGYETPSDCGSAGTSPCGRAPAAVPGIDDAIAVAAGFDHALVLRADGTALAFGDNSRGQLGVADVASRTAPGPIAGLERVDQLAAGSAHSLALTRDGHVYAWGHDQHGQLGQGTSDTAPHPVPARVPALDRVIAIAAANHTSYALRADGTVWAWGQNQNGQLGVGTEAGATSPVQVLTAAATDGMPAVPLTGVESLAADGFVALAVTTDGDVYAWGLGGLGQLGMGLTAEGERDLESRSVATRIVVPDADRPRFVVLEAELGSGGGAYVLTTHGELYGWGWSFRGSLLSPELIHAWAYTSPFLIPLP